MKIALMTCVVGALSVLTACEDEEACFAAGSLINTPTGLVPIESIQPGQSVYSYDFTQRRVTIAKVTHTFRHVNRLFRSLEMGNSPPIKVTPNHPIYAQNKHTFVSAGDLVSGDKLLKMTQSQSTNLQPHVLSEVLSSGETPGTVYNLSVDTHHNYFVEGVLVHNKQSLYDGGQRSKDGGQDASLQ